MRSFEMELVLTERCNMACKYCYMSNRPIDMTIDTFHEHYEKALPYMMKKYGCDSYRVVFFGGEPLLNWSLIEYIVPIFQKDSRCKFIMALTNGIEFKKEKKRRYFEQNNLGFSLSFDGLWNKDTRVLKDGSSSYDLYMTEPLKSFFSGSGGCKVMVSPQNITTMVENYQWFVEEFKIVSPDFSLVRDDVWTDDDVTLFNIEAKILADQMIKYIKSGIPSMLGFFQLYILDLIFGAVQGKRPFGCFACCNGAGFMPDGKVYPCARFGSNKEEVLIDSHGSFYYDHTIDKLMQPHIVDPRTYEKCKECTLYKYCNAGCTYEQTKKLRSIESFPGAEPIDNVCKLFHILYRESIRITHELKSNKLFKELLQNTIKNVG